MAPEPTTNATHAALDASAQHPAQPCRPERRVQSQALHRATEPRRRRGGFQRHASGRPEQRRLVICRLCVFGHFFF
jgi:hypothetical protein